MKNPRIWWSFAAVAILGTLLVSARLSVWWGHVLWCVSNAGLIALNWRERNWSMVALWSAYLCLALYGLWAWA